MLCGRGEELRRVEATVERLRGREGAQVGALSSAPARHARVVTSQQGPFGKPSACALLHKPSSGLGPEPPPYHLGSRQLVAAHGNGFRLAEPSTEAVQTPARVNVMWVTLPGEEATSTS